jgi:hypothetical protein
MKPIADLMGMTFGDWAVVRKAEVWAGETSKKTRWLCRCTCGVEKAIFATHLLRGKSNGCSPKGTHGIGKSTPGYSSWASMKARCSRPEHPAYHRYGGRGITVCDRWQQSFAAFYEDMGPRPEGKSLERIDGDGNYEPGNCRWATAKEQANNMCTNRTFLIGGERFTATQLQEMWGIDKRRIIRHLGGKK